MKFRRALATAVAAAAIAPATLMVAPAAFAAEAASATPTAAASSAPAVGNIPADTTPSATASTTVTPTDAASATATSTATSTATPSGTPSTEPSAPVDGSEPVICQEQNANYKATLDVSISGLPGKIAAGSGWHQFKITLNNPSSSDINGIVLGAGVGPTDAQGNPGPDPYTTSQVKLQAYDPDAKVWFDVSDDGSHAFGSLGTADLPAGETAQADMRLEVAPTAPLGKGLTIAFGAYPDQQNNCEAVSFAQYDLEIVAPGKPSSGTPVPSPKGGRTPLPKNPPKGGSNNIIPVSQTTGNLAHTGASSATPIIAAIGGAAVVLGAGAMFVVRRRKSGSAA